MLRSLDRLGCHHTWIEGVFCTFPLTFILIALRAVQIFVFGGLFMMPFAHNDALFLVYLSFTCAMSSEVPKCVSRKNPRLHLV